MTPEYQIIDNVMPDDEFQEFYKHMMSDNFPWYHSDTVAYGELKGKTIYDWLPEHVKLELTDTQRDLLSGPITKDQQEYNYTFFHRLFENFYITSDDSTWHYVNRILKILNVKALIRAKANAYPKTPTIVHHQDHMDQDYDHKGAIFYLNKNNGVTVLNGETIIESVPNRLLLFNSKIPHHSTTCTDVDRRVNLNFNYF